MKYICTYGLHKYEVSVVYNGRKTMMVLEKMMRATMQYAGEGRK
jgi:hypothetical protein